MPSLGAAVRQSESARSAALTRPHLTTQLVVAAPDEPQARVLSEDLGGARIAVGVQEPPVSYDVVLVPASG